MEAHSRVFPFPGSALDYIRYLESMLLKALDQLPSTPRSDAQSTSKPRHDRRLFINSSPHMFAKSYHQKKIPKPLAGLPQWEKDLKRFLASISPPQKWNDARAAAGFGTIYKNGLAIQLLLGQSMGSSLNLEPYEGGATPLQPEDDIGLITRGCQYGRIVARCADDAEFAIRIKNYHELVFVCFCTVLLFVGNSEDTVNWMMRQFISNSGDKNLHIYRSGCLWVNRCIVKLLDHRWGYKSWEIFMLCELNDQVQGRNVL